LRRLFRFCLLLTLSGPALTTAHGQTQVSHPDVNTTSEPADTTVPDTSVGSINDSSSGLKIRVPDGFGGVTTVPDDLNASKRVSDPDVSNSNADRKQ
jgi:hypothetical protein